MIVCSKLRLKLATIKDVSNMGQLWPNGERFGLVTRRSQVRVSVLAGVVGGRE